MACSSSSTGSHLESPSTDLLYLWRVNWGTIISWRSTGSHPQSPPTELTVLVETPPDFGWLDAIVFLGCLSTFASFRSVFVDDSTRSGSDSTVRAAISAFPSGHRSFCSDSSPSVRCHNFAPSNFSSSQAPT